MIVMTHPKTKGTITVPDRSQKVYERSGWELDEKATKALQEETPAQPEDSSATDKDTGEAGPRSGARKASTSKEEGK